MLELLNQKLVSFASLHKNKSVWRKLVTVLASIAVFCVTYALILPAITAEQEIFCGQEEHEHTEECYVYEPVLICGYESGEQAPAAAAAVPETVPAGAGEPVAAEAAAQPEEIAPDAAADVRTEQTADNVELTAPIAGETVIEAAADIAELAVEPESEIIPVAPAVRENAMEYQTVPAAAAEQQETESGTHVHTVECYKYIKTLVCEQEEHTHALQCYSDPSADVEGADVWQNMSDKMKFCGDIRKDVLAFAESQLGYAESEKNYVVLEDGVSTHGYTRFGGWYGDPYGDWCAMFCSFCLHYSGVEDYPLEGNCQRWIDILSEKYGENGAYYRPAGTYEPRPGDLVFFDWDGFNSATPENRVADHVGFVCEVEKATDETPARIKIIEGNHNSLVGHRSFELTDPQIMGYGVLTEDEVIVIEREFKGEDYTVYVSYGKDAEIPEEAELVVRELMPDTREFQNCYEQTLETLKAQDDQVEDIGFIRFFDVSFCVGRKEIEPSAPVNVRIVYDNPIIMDDNAGEMAIHFADSGDIELPETSASQSVDYAPENSVNTFEFTTDSFSVIGAGTVNYKDQTGIYYQKVDKLEVGQTYLIVSTEGNMALRRGGTNYQNIDLLPVKGFPGYYTVDGGVDARLRWGLLAADGTTAANVYRLQSSERNTNYLRLGGDTVVSTDANDRNILFAYDAQKGSWTLRCNNSQTYYLLNSGADFTRGSGTTRVNRTDVDNVARQFSIYKEVNTTLRIPDDVVGGGGSGSGSDSTKPTYPDDAAEGLSGAIDQGFTQAGLPADVQNAEGTVKWAYASDPATSEIEQYYKQSSYLEHVKRDGMVTTDKSVIFGKDDYNAFSSYESGEFSAALSALGQEYHLQIVDQVRIPVDVMFVLDVSGSMKEETSNAGETRLQALVKATNNAIRQIMEDNPNNRAGIALYSSGGQVLLPLDHYDYDHSHAFDETNAYVHIVGDTTYTTTATNYVQPTDYVKTQKGLGNATFQQAWGTYTQYGIQLGAQELLDNTDTTYTQTLHAGTEYAQDITVVRKPVMILLSDGDPTHCTPNYTDVLNGPHYGNGQAGSGNNMGVLGYYTILTANYFKRMVGINYETQATFYTIGLGINAEGIEDFSDSSATGDHYKRAVLNPSAANIAALNNDSAKNHETTADMLKELLNNESDAYAYVEVGTPGTTKFPQLGPTQSKVSIIDNPYTGNYSYADGAYFGNLNADDLTKVFSDIITSNIKVKTYGFMLNQRVGSGAKVTIVDPIGEGMEVNMDLGQRPILRYNGQNFAATSATTSGNVTTLVYNHIATTTDGSGGVAGERSVDLSEISVTITTADGKQTVQMQIPETILPSYTPGPDGSGYYYEELPVRLIYKVRLTEASKAAVRNLSDGEELTFYTNEWNKGTSAYSTQNPHEDNPYYCDVTYFKEDGVTVDPNNPRRNHEYKEPLTYQKTENPTATAHTSFDSKASAFSSSGAVVPNGSVTMALGNNGKLVFKASTGTDLEATKVWKDEENHDLADPGVASITLQLLQNGVPYGAPVTVTAADEWKHLFSDLPMVDSTGHAFVYTLEEDDIFGFYNNIPAPVYNSTRGIYEVTVTNRKLPTKDLPVEKRWTDTGHSGDSVTVHLYADGADTGLSVVLNQGNNWRYVFEGIPARDKDNHEIVYTLREDPFPNYTATYTEGNIDFADPANGHWETVSPSDGFSADAVYRILSQNGNLVTANGNSLRVEVTSNTSDARRWHIVSSGTSYTLQNVGTGGYLNLGNGTAGLSTSPQNLTIGNDGRINATGTSYYLRHRTVSGNMLSGNYSSSGIYTIQRWVPDTDTRSGLIVRNEPRSGVEISADKIWNGVPDSAKTEVTLKVYDVTISNRNASDTGRTLVLNSANGWHSSISGLPRPPSGHAYAVVETGIPGFAASYNHEGTIRIDGVETKAYYPGSQPASNELLEVEVTNELSFTMPQTGGSGIFLYAFGGSLLIAASAAMYILIVRRRRERGEIL